MSILTGPEIARQRELGHISVTPWDSCQLNPNSYDLRLGPKLLSYREDVLDFRKPQPTVEVPGYSDGGWWLVPGQLYLGSTVERIHTDKYVSVVDGKSSVGRLGLWVHVTAGFIDQGFDGHVTLEMCCVEPVIIYPGMPICQLRFETVEGETLLYAGKYQNQGGDPVASRYHQNFETKT